MNPEPNEFTDLFAPEPSPSSNGLGERAWKVLLVDDEADIHAAFRLALQDMEVDGLPLRLFDARSAGEAKALLAQHADMALVLLDVVMETEQAGLALVRQIRQELGNRMVQIVLVTGQPGYAPERDVVANYEIDGYRLKSELTSDKIFVSVYAALRTYHALRELARQREALEDLTRTLREREERLRSVVETAPDAIILIDSTGIISGWNKGAETLFGYTQKEMLGQPLNRVIPQRHRAGHNAAIERFHAGGEPRLLGRSIELEGLRKDGVECPIELVMGSWEAPAGRNFSAVIRDITERRKNEAELQRHRHHLEQLVEERTTALSLAKEAAEDANRAKSIFLANMSHELRTPMNAIIGMTALVRRHANDAKQIYQLDKVTQASHHLLAIINDILDISKIEAERLSLERVGFKLGGVLENLTSLTAQKLADKGLALALDIPPMLVSQPLLGDPLRLGQILLNLTGNAIKFTAQGGITLRARLLEESPADMMLRFEVRDSGIGISSEDMKRLFTAFEQADGSTTRKYGGTGLGLAISKRLTRMMGGDIGVESQLGAGSTFWFTVRLAKMEDAPEAMPELGASSSEKVLRARFSGTHILLAEDEPINQEVSRGLLEDVGLQVDLAEDGAIAVEMARRNDYSLILMDLQMPKMNGVEATRAIRAIPGRQHTPILAMTANAFDEDRRECLDAGMDEHISKPVDPGVLFETLLKWLSMPDSH